MNTSKAALIFSLAVLCAAPGASAQSLKEKLKKATEKVEQQVDQAGQKVKQKVGQQTGQQIKGKTGLDVSKKSSAKSGGNSDRNSELEKRVDAMVGADNNKNLEDQTPTVRLPETHTALFAPLGYPVEADYGVKKVKPSKPPKDADDQVEWSEKLPYVRDLDNQSLVDEYLLLKSLFDDGYIAKLTPASWRFNHLVSDELWARVNALNGMVSKYNEIKGEYKLGDDTYNWVINGLHAGLVEILSSDPYKTVLRSSLEPIFNLKDAISEDTRKKLTAAMQQPFRRTGRSGIRNLIRKLSPHPTAVRPEQWCWKANPEPQWTSEASPMCCTTAGTAAPDMHSSPRSSRSRWPARMS